MKPLRQIAQNLRSEIDLILPKANTDKITLLYIDDEPLNLRAFKGVFRRSNFNILTATNLEDAFKLLSTNKVHILFTDYEMPITKGDEVLKIILTLYPNIIPVVLSAYLTIERQQRLKSHFQGITLIEKPFRSEQVAEIINRCFAIWQSSAA